MDKEDLERPDSWSRYMIAAAVLLTVVVLGLYAVAFAKAWGLSKDPAIWGQFGDYVGGILGPAIALFALWAIFHAIKLQRRELRLSVQELARSTEALQHQVEHLASERQINDLRAAVQHIEVEADLLLTAATPNATIREAILGDPGISQAEHLVDRLTAIKWFDENKINAGTLTWKIAQDAIQVCIRLEHLATLLYRLDTVFGQTHFVSAVKSKYNPIVSKLYQKNYLHGETAPYLMQVEELPKAKAKDGAPIKFYQIH